MRVEIELGSCVELCGHACIEWSGGLSCQML